MRASASALKIRLDREFSSNTQKISEKPEGFSQPPGFY
jgi:hypothetical protein